MTSTEGLTATCAAALGLLNLQGLRPSDLVLSTVLSGMHKHIKSCSHFFSVYGTYSSSKLLYMYHFLYLHSSFIYCTHLILYEISSKKLVHFAEQPAIVVGTGAVPSDSEDSDDYYERMESPPPPTLSPQANTALLGYKQRMMGSEAPIVRLCSVHRPSYISL